MTRLEQIEALGVVWEALGDGRWTNLFTTRAGLDAGSHFGHETEPRRPIHTFMLDGSDTEDATPCLAILRDVYGEDVDVFHLKDEDGESWNVGPVTARTCYYSVSFVSRIHAVILALEAKKRSRLVRRTGGEPEATIAGELSRGVSSGVCGRLCQVDRGSADHKRCL